MDFKLDNDTGDIILKILGVALAFLSLRWLVRIFSGKDGRLNPDELKKLTAFALFIWAFIYVLVKEGNRPSGTAPIYSEFWVFFIISALLTVLHIEGVMDMYIKLRSKTTTETTTEISQTKKETHADEAP